jgi:hypothetical protein
MFDPYFSLESEMVSGFSCAVKISFDTASEDRPTNLLPSLVHIATTESLSWRVRSLLRMHEAELKQSGPVVDLINADTNAA